MSDKIKPCKKCGSTDIWLSDAGYRELNTGGGICRSCGYQVIRLVGDDPSQDVLRLVWNSGQRFDDGEKLQQERRKTRELRKQLRTLGETPVI